MKAFRSWIIAILLLAIVGYTAFWFYQAHLLKNMLQEKQGQVEKAPTYDFTLRFDDLETSGYPFSINLAIANPKIDCSLKSGLLDLSINFDGKMTNSFTPFGQLEKVSTKGKTHITVKGADSKAVFEGFGDGEMTLQSKSKGYLWSAVRHPFSTKKEDFEDVMLHISPLKCSGLIRDKKTAGLQINDALLHYQRNPSAQTLNFSSDFILDPTESSSATAQEFSDMCPQDTIKPFLVIVEKALQKQKIEKYSCSFDMQVDLPGVETLEKISAAPMMLAFSPIPKFAIDVKKFNISHNSGDLKSSGYCALSEDAQRQVLLTFGKEVIFKTTEASYTQCITTINTIAEMVAQDLKPDNEDLARIKTLFVSHLDDVRALVPKLYQLGATKWGGKGSFEINKETYNCSGNLSHFGFTNDLYGVFFNLDAKRQDEKISCKADLNCIKYKDLVGDFIAYFNRFTTVFNLLKHDDARPLNPVSKETTAKIFEYLLAISDTPESESADLKITYTYDNGRMRIGTLTLERLIPYSKELFKRIEGEVCPGCSSTPSPQPKGS